LVFFLLLLRIVLSLFFYTTTLLLTPEGLGVIDDNLYLFVVSLPGDFAGDVGLDLCVIDDLYLMGISILKLNM
jgi:hypothetical protein